MQPPAPAFKPRDQYHTSRDNITAPRNADLHFDHSGNLRGAHDGKQRVDTRSQTVDARRRCHARSDTNQFILSVAYPGIYLFI